MDPLAISCGSPIPSLQTLLKITWMNKWLDGQMNKWALSGSLSVSIIYAGEAWWESENWFVAAGVYILFFMRECSSLGEECNREQMSLNEHVKTIREGLQWMEKPEWSQKTLTWTGYQSPAEEMTLDHDCSDLSGSFPQLKGLTWSLISITGQDFYRNTTTWTNRVFTAVIRHNLRWSECLISHLDS